MRGDLGVREPGVGAEASEIPPENDNNNLDFNLDDVKYQASRSESRSTSRSRSEVETEQDFENDDDEGEIDDTIVEDGGKMKEDDVETLRMKVRSLAVRPIEGCGDGQQDAHENWESELNATVDKLDHLMLLREKTQGSIKSEPQSPVHPVKQLQKQNPLPLSIVSLQSLPTSQNALPFNSRFLNESTTINCDNLVNKKRKLSLG